MISVNNYSEKQIQLSIPDQEFIETLNNKLTMYGQLQYTIPTNFFIIIIKEAARYFFRMGYWRSQQTVFYRLPKTEIIEFLRNRNHCCDEPACKNYPNCECDGTNHKTHHVHPEEIDDSYRNLRGYAIKLPGFVNAIREIYESNKHETVPDEAFNSQNEFLTNMQRLNPYGYSLMGINNHLYYQEVCVSMMQSNVYQSVYGTSVPFSYNNSTKTLILNKEIKPETVSLMIQCVCNVDLQYLYEDDLFNKFVYARCKQELKRLIASHTLQLPGEVTLNPDEICANWEQEIQEVRDELKGATGIGDLILQR